MGKYAELKGLDIMQGDLRKIIDKVSNTKIKEILVKNAGFVADAMEAKAPVNTGQLQSSIRIFDSEKYKHSVMIAPDFKKNNRDNITGHALISILEFGARPAVAGAISKKSKDHKRTNERGYWHAKIDGQWVTLKETQGIKQQAFIRPAFDITRQKVTAGIGKDINKALKEAAKETKTIG